MKVSVYELGQDLAAQYLQLELFESDALGLAGHAEARVKADL